MRPDHGGWVAHRVGRVAGLDSFSSCHHPLHETVDDVFLHQQSRLAGADLALIQCEEHRALHSLVQERVVLVADRREENAGRFAAKLQSGRDEASRRRLRQCEPGESAKKENEHTLDAVMKRIAPCGIAGARAARGKQGGAF
eukprot:scaffold10011_cov97-Isochrysis_galbana.AAC.1